MKRILFIAAILLPGMLQAQSLTDVTVERERVFTGSGLYGFMNGGADLFLEYGVQQLNTQDVKYKGESYTIEIYEMPLPADAFGIYSLHTFKCLRADTLGFFNCLSKYQLQAAVGSKYISIVFQSGSAQARKNVDELFFLYVDTTNVEKLVVPKEFEANKPYSGTLKYLRGKLSASSALQALPALLNGIVFSEIWFVSNKSTKENRALIQLFNDEDTEQLKVAIPQSDIIEIGERFIYTRCSEKDELNSNFGSFAF